MVKTKLSVLMVTGRIQKPKEAAYQPCESYEILIFDAMKKTAELTQEDAIKHILDMKNGNEKCTPQPDYARWRMLQLHQAWPEMDLLAGIKQALETK